MFYKIRNDILFRQYEGHGYIADNSEFGYRLLDDVSLRPGEEYVSESGSVMLAVLSKSPRDIEDVIDDLMQVFVGVDRDVLREDASEFFQMLTDRGFLSVGDTLDSCVDQQLPSSPTGVTGRGAIVPVEDCGRDTIGPDDFLRSIHFDIASACNERCVHCYMPQEYKTGTIDSDLFYQILEEARRLNIIHVTLSGGEPLLHRDFIDFLVRCRKLDLSVNVLSNLTLLTDDIVAEMRKNPLLSVQASLYSMDATVHDSITRQHGSFEKTRAGILKVLSAGIPVQISCPVMKQNKDTFLDVVVWGREHGIAVAIEPVIFASLDHLGGNLESRISLEDLEGVLDKELSEGYVYVLSDAAKEKEPLTGSDPICSICRYSLCVSVNGEVFPCAGWQTNVLGNLNQQTLQDVWAGSEKIRQLRGIRRSKFPKCVDCADRGYCTVCMMCNSNENPDGDPYAISDFRCKVAATTHRKVSEFLASDLSRDRAQLIGN